VLLLGGGVVVVPLGEVVLLFLWCFLFFLCVLVPFAFVSVVLVDELDCEVEVDVCGCSEIELLELFEVEPFGLVEVAVPASGVWLWGGVVLWVWAGVAVFVVEFSGVVVVEVGFATLPADSPVWLLVAGVWDEVCEPALPATPPVVDCALFPAFGVWEPETPDPSCDDGDALQVSAMCFTLVTVKFFEVEDEDCVWPLLLADADELMSLPVDVPESWTWCPTCAFRSDVAPLSW
jgi:hypothetical protein